MPDRLPRRRRAREPDEEKGTCLRDFASENFVHPPGRMSSIPPDILGQRQRALRQGNIRQVVDEPISGAERRRVRETEGSRVVEDLGEDGVRVEERDGDVREGRGEGGGEGGEGAIVPDSISLSAQRTGRWTEAKIERSQVDGRAIEGYGGVIFEERDARRSLSRRERKEEKVAGCRKRRFSESIRGTSFESTHRLRRRGLGQACSWTLCRKKLPSER